MLETISIEKIYPHPDNPRKNLGDLTELADSIKASGILQNLTLVPDHNWYNTETKEFERYTVIIGHRRLAAAKLAGLTEVPCSIAEMDPKTQVATMLLENMQRSDLTIREQAEGFQMMLDLGESISGIAQKTGFSETTVRHRVKLNDLDKKKFNEAVERGGTIQDYIDLEKIQDPKRRNKVLEAIGTRNFDWELQNAIEEEESAKRKPELLAFLKDWAKPVKQVPNGGVTYEHNFYHYKINDFKKPKDAGKAEYFYCESGQSISLYKKAANLKKKKTAAEISFKERESQLKAIAKRAYGLRCDFIKNFNATKKHAETINAFVLNRILTYGQVDWDSIIELLEIDIPEAALKELDYTAKQRLKRELILHEYAKQPEQVLLVATYCGFTDSKEKDYFDIRGWEYKIAHEKNESLDAIYDCLIALGYEMSDEELKMRNGMHELFDLKS